MAENILVTGGCGFIGSHFVRYLLQNKGNCNVFNLDNLSYAGDEARLKDIAKNKNYHFVKADLRNIADIEEVFSHPIDTVVHLAAESHVDNSIKDPFVFEEVNVRGALNLLSCTHKYKVKKFVHISCYDETTRALTIKGFKTYKELRKGDLVFSLNPHTKEIELKPIEKVIIQKYKGSMIHFNNRRIDLLVTPNHNMFILNSARKLINEPAWKSCKRSIFYMPRGCWKGIENESFYVKSYGRVNTNDLFYILGIFIGDGFTAYQEKISETITGLSRKSYLLKARDKISGRFKSIVRQGSYKSINRGYRIFFDIPENDACRPKVERALSRMGIKYHAHKGKAGTHLYFTSRAFMKFFNQCGQGAVNKHIPHWVLAYSQEYLKYLFEGLMDSDGSKNRIYFTVSPMLVSNIVELSMKLGLKPNINKRYCISYIRSRKIEGESYYISFGETEKSISRNRIREVNYAGDIWCLKVKDNKNFIVERNGKIDFCGNTDEVYGEIKQGKFTEESPLAPNSPYSASKAAADFLVRAYVRTYNFPAVIIRPSNNYGPWQYPEKFIPVAISSVLSDKKIPVYAQGLNCREWLYVTDCAKGIALVMDKGVIGEVYNLGSGMEKRNIDVAREILKLLGKEENFIDFVTDRPGHDFRYSLDSSKIKALGFSPQMDFQTGIKNTVEWYKEKRTWTEEKLGI